MKTKFKILILALALGTATSFVACSDDEDNPGDRCDGLSGIELADCLE